MDNDVTMEEIYLIWRSRLIVNTEEDPNLRCDSLDPEKHWEIRQWFEQPNEQHNEQRAMIYSKPIGSLDHAILRELFSNIDRNIERLVLVRAQPGFKKEVGGRSRLFVGSLQENQWEIYKQSKSVHHAPKQRRRNYKIPGNTMEERLKERLETLEWETAGNFPPLFHKEVWWITKWFDPKDKIIWRSWLRKFSITWNSYHSTVYVGFEYVTQHYSKDMNCWVFV